MNNWEKEEMGYWEKYSFAGPIIPPRYRLFEREKFLFRLLRNNIRGKTLIEIGCWFPHDIMVSLNPSKYKYDYVGVDVVSHALVAANKYLQEGMFVRCSATNLPFKTESFDIILSLGVLHHLSRGVDNISQLSRSLRRNGLFVLTEVVERRTLTNVLNDIRHGSPSPHEGRLNPEKLIEACLKSGRIMQFDKNGSVVLGMFLVLMDVFPILQQSNTYLRFIIAIDQLVIRTLGRISSLFDAGAYFIIWKKS